MQPRKILLVDDEPSVRDGFALLLRRDGFRVDAVSTGHGAIQKLRSDSFDLAIIDWRLTDMTGLDVAEAMKNDHGRLTPWILVSGYMDFEIARQAGRLGAVKALSYPFDVQSVVTDALKEVSSRAKGWSWVPTVPMTAAMTAAERWAALVQHACDAQSDPSTIPAWATAAGVCETKIHTTCAFLNISARQTRDFARILRALRKSAGQVAKIEAHMIVADPRTWDALLERAGLCDRSPDAVVSFEDFLAAQKFVPHDHLGLAMLRSSITRL